MAEGISWSVFFEENKELVEEILKEIEKDREKGYEIYPEKEKIFRAFDICKLSNLKVVIVGQDSYHGLDRKTGKIQANGLCFSVESDCVAPPSLINIFKELLDDTGENREETDLKDWGEQGILLLNAGLCVRSGKPGSYLKLWEKLTDKVIEYISEKMSDIVFILWGNYAKNKEMLIEVEKHKIIKGNHPSPLSANRGGFFGEKYFTRTNEYLKEIGKEEIKWV